MKHVQAIEIDRPVTEVYEYVTDPTRLPEWDTDIRRGRVLTDGDIRVGSRIEIERTLPPSRRYGSLRGTITEHDPSVGFAVSIDEGAMPFDLRYDFEDRGDRTWLQVVVQSHPRGPRRIIEAVFAPLIHRSVATHYARLKSILEGRAGGE